MPNWFDEAMGELTAEDRLLLLRNVDEISKEVNRRVAENGEKASEVTIEVCKRILKGG